MPRQDYEDRQERRRERLEGRAAKKGAEADSRFAKASRKRAAPELVRGTGTGASLQTQL